uniref:Uncharacterized protein n=1 Tax=Physcomitrium patens TaxID=3218 RepID=A0A7I4ER18_PHYPA
RRGGGGEAGLLIAPTRSITAVGRSTIALAASTHGEDSYSQSIKRGEDAGVLRRNTGVVQRVKLHLLVLCLRWAGGDLGAAGMRSYARVVVHSRAAAALFTAAPSSSIAAAQSRRVQGLHCSGAFEF